MKTIIIDDERLARVNLKRLLEAFPDIQIAGEADSCTSAVEAIIMHQPELIFLDIQLGGETGFDLLEMIDLPVSVIFVTAYDEYAIRAFEVNASDYLLKPVSPERLKLSVDRILEEKNEKNEKRENQEQNSPSKVYEYSDTIYVQLNNYTSKFIKISSITYIEPVGNYTRIVTVDGKRCLVLKTLKQWEEELPSKNFIRIHRSSIVNIEQVDRIERHTNSHHQVFLKNVPEPLEVSRRFASQLKATHHII